MDENVVLWTILAFMDDKRRFMDEICHLWTRLALMDDKRRFMDEICQLWTKFALVDEKRIFQWEKKYQPLIVFQYSMYQFTLILYDTYFVFVYLHYNQT